MVIQLSELSFLSWQRFDDEWVVFNEGFGETVVADPLTLALLTALEFGKCSQQALVGQVAKDFQLDDHEQLESLLQERIDSLSKMGWIESEQE